MSRQLSEYEHGGSTEFNLGDIVSFDHRGAWMSEGDEPERLTGEVVRVYSTRLNYHVEVNGTRYEVEVPNDNPQLERRKR